MCQADDFLLKVRQSFGFYLGVDGGHCMHHTDLQTEGVDEEDKHGELPKYF